MVELTMQIPDELAKRVVPMSRWLPTILELSLVGFKTPAAETAGELIDFLSEAPSRRKLLIYHVSNRAQGPTTITSVLQARARSRLP